MIPAKMNVRVFASKVVSAKSAMNRAGRAKK
jgi:hypothetical protein